MIHPNSIVHPNAKIARGVEIGPKKYRLSDKPRGRRPDIFKDHWAEMVQCLEEDPDQTALELLIEFQTRYPGRYSLRQLYTLQKRVRTWRREAIDRLITGESGLTPYVFSNSAAGNILREAAGNKIT